MGGDRHRAAARNREVPGSRRPREPGRHRPAPARRPRQIPARVADGHARLGAAAHQRVEGARTARRARSRGAPGAHGEPRGLGLRADHLHRPALQPRHANGCGPVAGAAAPLDGSAASTVLLAGRRATRSRRCGATGCVQTRHTSVDELEIDLEVVRRHGWAHNDAEDNVGGCAVAAPVRDAEGNVAAAISLDLADTFSRAKFDLHARAVVAAASRITPRFVTTRRGVSLDHAFAARALTAARGGAQPEVLAENCR